MTPHRVARVCAVVAAIALSTTAQAQRATAQAQDAAKTDLVRKVLKNQQAEIEAVARAMVERPAAQMAQQADIAIRNQAPAENRQALGRAVEAEVKKYIDETYPIVRDRAMQVAPKTAGAVLEEKMSEDELKRLVVWLESPLNRKFQQIAPDMRNAFIQKMLTDGRPLIEPNVVALDAKIRAILGAPATPATPGSSPVVKPGSR